MHRAGARPDEAADLSHSQGRAHEQQNKGEPDHLTTLQFSVIAPGVIVEVVELHTLKLAAFAVG
jgi:hypothetical protein